jgi:hypothetical protein
VDAVVVDGHVDVDDVTVVDDSRVWDTVTDNFLQQQIEKKRTGCDITVEQNWISRDALR